MKNILSILIFSFLAFSPAFSQKSHTDFLDYMTAQLNKIPVSITSSGTGDNINVNDYTEDKHNAQNALMDAKTYFQDADTKSAIEQVNLALQSLQDFKEKNQQEKAVKFNEQYLQNLIVEMQGFKRAIENEVRESKDTNSAIPKETKSRAEQIRDSMAREIMIMKVNMEKTTLSNLKNAFNDAGPNLNEELKKKGVTPFRILKTTMSCRDDYCRNISIQLEAGDPSIEIGTTMQLGEYKTEAFDYVVNLFVAKLIDPIIRDRNIKQENISVSVTGTADAHPISKSGISYKKDCGNIQNLQYFDENTKQSAAINLRQNKIHSNTQLAYVRAHCAAATLKTNWKNLKDVSIQTKVYSKKEEGFRKIEILVNIDDFIDVTNWPADALQELSDEVERLGN